MKFVMSIIPKKVFDKENTRINDMERLPLWYTWSKHLFFTLHDTYNNNNNNNNNLQEVALSINRTRWV